MYKRNRSQFVLLCVVMTLIIGGCRYGTGSIENVTTEDFDINTAINMIEELEIPILKFESDHCTDIRFCCFCTVGFLIINHACCMLKISKRPVVDKPRQANRASCGLS